jgi:hypothetical protein
MKIGGIQVHLSRALSDGSPAKSDISLRRDEFEVEARSGCIRASRTLVTFSRYTDTRSVGVVRPQIDRFYPDERPLKEDRTAPGFAKADKLWLTPRLDICPTIDIFV